MTYGNSHGYSRGIPLKKGLGQHFLRDSSVTDRITRSVVLTQESSVFEIGCGDGFLTKAILAHPLARLWVFEIDQQWVSYIRGHFPDPRLTVYEENILDLDFSIFESHKPWILLANLPYQITFPILQRLQEHRHLWQEGVIMVQEEVAQKIMRTSGRGYGFTSLFFQHYFTWQKLDKISPGAFYPAPKVHSRLLHFAPKKNVTPIPDEAEFWKFIKICFRQPRRTLKNNLAQSHYDWHRLSEDQISLRAQQMGIDQLLALWKILH